MLFLKFCAQLGSVRPKSLFLCAQYRFFVVDFAFFDKLVCLFTHHLVFHASLTVIAQTCIM